MSKTITSRISGVDCCYCEDGDWDQKDHIHIPSTFGEHLANMLARLVPGHMPKAYGLCLDTSDGHTICANVEVVPTDAAAQLSGDSGESDPDGHGDA